MKDYVRTQTIPETRKWFRTRYSLQPFAGNFSHDRKYARTDWLCRCKEAQVEEGRIMTGNCKVYGDLKSQFGDLQEDANLVEFFKAVLDRRDTLEDEDRKQHSAVVDARWDFGDKIPSSRPRDLHPIGSLQF